MAAKYWIKLYHEILDDPKMGRMPNNLWRRCVEFFLLAGEQDEGGRLPSIADMAWRLRVDEQTLQQEVDQLARLSILDYRSEHVLDGYWFVVNFYDRQKAMSKAEHMRRLRKSRQGLPSSDQPSYQPVTNSNADTDTDIDIDKSKKRSHNETQPKPKRQKKPTPVFEIPDNLETSQFKTAWSEFLQLRRELKKPLTQVGGNRLLKRLGRVGEVEAVARLHRAVENGYQGVFFPGDEVHYKHLDSSTPQPARLPGQTDKGW